MNLFAAVLGCERKWARTVSEQPCTDLRHVVCWSNCLFSILWVEETSFHSPVSISVNLYQASFLLNLILNGNYTGTVSSINPDCLWARSSKNSASWLKSGKFATFILYPFGLHLFAWVLSCLLNSSGSGNRSICTYVIRLPRIDLIRAGKKLILA